MPETEWWYVNKGQRLGPESAEQIVRKMSSGELSANCRVWSKGLSGWTTATEVSVLSDTLKNYPPPIAGEDIGSDTSLPQQSTQEPPSVQADAPTNGNLWARYLARQLDVVIFAAVGGAVIAAWFPTLFEYSLLENTIVANVFFVALALLIEVPLFAFTGSTIGKWLFGITVRRADGSHLTASEVFQRNVNLWVRGFALGIPVVLLFTMGKSFQVAKSGKRSAWDEKAAHNVRHKEISRLRFGLGLAVIFIIIVGISALGSLDMGTL